MIQTIQYFKNKLYTTGLAIFVFVTGYLAFARQALAAVAGSGGGGAAGDCIKVDTGADGLGFTPPNLAQVLTFLIRGFFIIAGLLALFYLLFGALAYVTSGGSKEGTEKARDKIQAAVIGVILIVAVLAIIVTLEQIVFVKSLCFGVSCGISIPGLIKDPKVPGC